MIIASVYVMLSKCVHVTKGTVTRAHLGAPWEKGNIITVYLAQSHHRRPPYHKQGDLSSKVFQMAHSLYLVVGLVDHTKQFLLLIRTVFRSCFFSTMTLQTPGSKWTAMRHETFEWLCSLSCSISSRMQQEKHLILNLLANTAHDPKASLLRPLGSPTVTSVCINGLRPHPQQRTVCITALLLLLFVLLAKNQ